MNKPFLVAIAVALLAVPLAMAHEPRGWPKNYCEQPPDWNIHEYGPPATGMNLGPAEDGNVSGDCGSGSALGTPYLSLFGCKSGERSFDLGGFWLCIPTTKVNHDGHHEYAVEGAWIFANSGTGSPSADPNVGAGTAYCWGVLGHHADHGPVSIDDDSLGANASFTVYADTVDLTGAGEGCGDFEFDASITCTGTCTVPFTSLDGAYRVYAQGTLGHIIW